MRIALICDGPVPHDRMNYRGDVLLHLLPARGHIVYLVCATPSNGLRIVSPGNEIVQLNFGTYKPIAGALTLLIRLWQVFTLFRATKRVLREDVDIVRTVSLIPTVVAVLARAKRRPVPIVANISDFYADLYKGSRLPFARLADRLIRRIEKWCASVDVLIVDTTDQRERWVARGLPRSRCVAIPHGLPRSWSDEASVAVAVGRPTVEEGDKATVFYVGDISEMDGVDLLLCAIAILRDRKVSVRAVLIGRGASSYMRGLFELVKMLNIEGLVEHIPSVANRELPQRMAMATVCVAPFRLRDTSATSIPNKVLEYLTTNKPIVVPFGSALERLFGDAFIYFKPGDAESLASAIQRGLNQSAGPAGASLTLRAQIRRCLNWRLIAAREWHLMSDAARDRVEDAECYDYAIGLKPSVPAGEG